VIRNLDVTRKTKIIATLGPACESAEAVRALVDAGMDVARLNFSHGDHETHRRFAGWVRAAAEATGRAVTLLQDVQGPKIRVGTFRDGHLVLDEGEQVTLYSGHGQGDGRVVFVDYPYLDGDILPGEKVLLADGLIRLEVENRIKGGGLLARVVEGGELSDHKGAAFPDSDLRLPSITEKDEVDLAFGRELGVDAVAASFVRSAADVEQVASLSGVPIIAKIELAAAYLALDEILETAHGAMVARGDLGVQLPLERLPMIQLDILSRTNATGTVSITATEMLESMIHNHRPTRAEVNDVASAVMAGTDAVMLSGETAVGRHPSRVVEMMDVICREAEGTLGPGSVRSVLLKDEEDFPSATAKAAVETAAALEIGTIVAFTESGTTARLLSKYRPSARIVAFTPSPATYHLMALYWGVQPLHFERLDNTDEMIRFAECELLQRGLGLPGERVVMVAGVPPNEQRTTNLMKLHELRG